MIDLDGVRLARGSHDTRSDGLCLMEAVALLAGEAHTDAPACVSPVLAAYGQAVNDTLPDEKRQRLKLLAGRLPGTADDGQDAARSWMALDWLVRIYTPAWLDLASLTEHADRLRALPPPHIRGRTQ